MNNKKMLSALLVASSFVHLQSFAATPYSDPNNSGKWVLNNAVSDEFSGNRVNTSKWKNLGTNGEYYGHWKGRAPSQFYSENVTVGSGMLTITSKWDPDFDFHDEKFNNGYHYGEYAPITTGSLVSKGMFKYGYMEVRAKAANGPISSSFWMTGKDGEIDVFEAYGKNGHNPYSSKNFHSSIYDWRVGSDNYGKRIWTNEHQLDFDMASGFHIYGFEWDPNYIKMFVDGKLINCVTKAELGDKWVIYNEQRVWIDSETFNWEVNPRTLTKEDFGNGQKFLVDYARVWQRNGTIGTGCDTQVNIVKNGGFESGTQHWQGDAVNSNKSYKGNNAGHLPSNGRIEQTVAVKPNTTYVLSAWVNSTETNETNRWLDAYLGVKGYGKAQVDTRFFYPRYNDKSIQFTTGANNTEATIFFTNDPEGGDTLVDNIQLVEVKRAGKSNLLNNKGFERNLTHWITRGNVSAVTNNSHWGNKSVYINGNGAVEQQVNLEANTTYKLSGWAKVSTNGQNAFIGIKGTGGQPISREVTSTSYSRHVMTFTTGPSNVVATFFYWNGNTQQRVYGDDFQLVVK